MSSLSRLQLVSLTLRPNSDQHQFSPNDINTLLTEKGVRMITTGKIL